MIETECSGVTPCKRDGALCQLAASGGTGLQFLTFSHQTSQVAEHALGHDLPSVF